MRTWVSVRFVVCGLAVLSALAGCGGSGGSAASSAAPSASAASGSSSGATTVKAMQITTSASAQGSVTVGQTFTLTPNVTGGSGKTLTFTVANAAPWMTFNAGTGVLTGTPTAANVGTYSNIVISVSDGQASASAAPFTIQVVAAAASTGSTGAGATGAGATGTADVSWTPPTTNTDGSTLTDLAGYYIYYGTSPSALTMKVQVSNIGVTNYVISGLTAGTWYFAVTAYSSAGTESSPSNLASKTIS